MSTVIAEGKTTTRSLAWNSYQYFALEDCNGMYYKTEHLDLDLHAVMDLKPTNMTDKLHTEEMHPYWLTKPASSLALTAAAIFLLAHCVTRMRMRKGGLPPGLPAVPVLGSLPFMYDLGGLGYHEYLTKLGQRYGSVYSLQLGNQFTVILNSYDVIREALVTNGAKFAGRGTRKFHACLASNPNMAGIAEAQFSPQWKTEKSVFQSTMSRSMHDSMEQTILSGVDDLLAELPQHEEVIDPRRLIRGTTLNVLLHFAIGSTFKHSELTDLLDGATDLLERCYKILDINALSWLRFFPWKRKQFDEFLSAHQKVLDQMNVLISKAVGEDQNETNFVKEHLKRIGGQDRDDLAYTLRDLMVAGTQTAATTTIWGLVHMANNPDVQVKVQREIDGAVHGGGVRMADMTSLPYTQAVIEEIHRIAAVLPLPVAHEVLEDAEISGHTIPKGSNVMVNLWAVSRDPDLWPDPEVFRPERFLTADGHFKRKAEVIPFSLGRRMCPGQDLARKEIFLIFSNLVQQFQLSPPEGVTKVNESALPHQIFRVPDDFSVRLHKRPQCAT